MYRVLLEGASGAFAADMREDVLAVSSKPISCWQLTVK